MGPIGLLLLLVGGFLMDEVVMGRTDSIISDAGKIGTSLIEGDFNTVYTTLTTRGVGNPAPVGSAETGTGVTSSEAGSNLVQEVEQLGLNKKYETGATGPDAYDCSGLVWKALKNLDIFTGARFTTSTFEHVATQFSKKVASAEIGDIVIDPSGHHMGVVIGQDQFYSAMNPHAGIGAAAISTFKVASGRVWTPDYWRLNNV